MRWFAMRVTDRVERNIRPPSTTRCCTSTSCRLAITWLGSEVSPLAGSLWKHNPTWLWRRVCELENPPMRLRTVKHLFRLGPWLNHGELLVITRGYITVCYWTWAHFLTARRGLKKDDLPTKHDLDLTDELAKFKYWRVFLKFLDKSGLYGLGLHDLYGVGCFFLSCHGWLIGSMPLAVTSPWFGNRRSHNCWAPWNTALVFLLCWFEGRKFFGSGRQFSDWVAWQFLGMSRSGCLKIWNPLPSYHEKLKFHF